MPVGTIVEALTGFSGAYWKIASELDPDRQHTLKVLSIHSSAGVIEPTIAISNSSRWIVHTILAVIAAKKHIKGSSYDVEMDNETNFVLVNGEESRLKVPGRAFEILESKMIDTYLNKVAIPLGAPDIGSVIITIVEKGETILSTEIKNDEIEYFQNEDDFLIPNGSELTGTLISLNKETNSGLFRMNDGRNIPYSYDGEGLKEFYQDFLFDGPIKAVCEAHFDEDSVLESIIIKSTHRLQPELCAS
jgi:hypothetical protein